ncbi:hypothetical protein [Limosilactobacillus mucosae]|uniref:hypothetical protein n=1 Tax=Limosilactobacillus mucosae TaxID=97478 RepID=UPI0022E41AFA|nr:hypothetical protein [Limosilactobacillus mucosae]
MAENQLNILRYLSLLVISVFIVFVKDPYLLILLATFLLFKIIKLARWSFFSELSVLLWYAFFEGVIQKTVGVTGNTLSWAGTHMPFYFDELSIATISFLLTELFFLEFTKIISNEKKIYGLNLGIPFGLAIFLSLISSILMVLVFPSLPTFTANLVTRRTQGLSSLYGLVLFSLVLSSLTVEQSFQHKILYIFYAFNIFWSFGHAERVEVLGYLSYIVLKSINFYKFSLNKKTYKKMKKIFYVIIIITILFAMYIGLTRMGNSKVTISSFFVNFLSQGTVGDVTYIFNCATDLWKKGLELNGVTYLDYLYRLIPGIHSNYSSETMLHFLYPETMGGQLFFAEPMMNFGLVGTVIMNIVFFIIMGWILHNSSKKYMGYFYIPIVIEIFRTAYYGRASWMLACFIEVPIIYFTIYIFKKIFYTTKTKISE